MVYPTNGELQIIFYVDLVLLLLGRNMLQHFGLNEENNFFGNILYSCRDVSARIAFTNA